MEVVDVEHGRSIVKVVRTILDEASPHKITRAATRKVIMQLQEDVERATLEYIGDERAARDHSRFCAALATIQTALIHQVPRFTGTDTDLAVRVRTVVLPAVRALVAAGYQLRSIWDRLAWDEETRMPVKHLVRMNEYWRSHPDGLFMTWHAVKQAIEAEDPSDYVHELRQSMRHCDDVVGVWRKLHKLDGEE